jgi:hypothetical protein
MSCELEFNEWVCERLAEWPTAQIVDLDRWLRKQGPVEFIPAVREVLRRRGIERERSDWRGSKRKLVDELVLRLRGLVLVRSLLTERGAAVVEIEEHTAEIDRMRAQLAEVVKKSAA